MKKILHKLLLIVNLLFAVALLISYLAVNINPEDFAFPAFFGLAYPYLLLFNIIFALIWAIAFKLEALISVIVIAVGFNHFSNYLKFIKPKTDKADSFKVMSYNLRLFNHFEKPDNQNSKKVILEFIKEQKPQIICFQEYFVNGNPELDDIEVKKALGGKYNSHIKFIERGKIKYYGIATYTQYPIINKGEILHPGSSSLSIYTDILIQKDTFRVFNNYLQSFRLKRLESSFFEELSSTEDNKAMSEIKGISVSLKEGFARRALQAQVVKDYVNRSPYPVIVVGDFNDTPVSYSYRKIRKGLNDAFVKSGYGAGFTYKGNYPPNRIDYILFDNNLISTCFDIFRLKYSDHYPIVGYFKKPR